MQLSPKALGLLLSVLPLTTAGTIELLQWVDSANPDFQTCSPYMTDVYGCTGWGENFCKSLTGNANCASCKGTQTTTGCNGASIEMNFDTNVVTFANSAGDRGSCTEPEFGSGKQICTVE